MGNEGRQLAARLAGQIQDQRVLRAIAEIPRDRFVPESLRDEAYANRALPIGRGQTISQPLVVARMAELLVLGPADRVLDVGTGSGYHAAVLAALAGHVWTIERHESLATAAEEVLREVSGDNVTCLVGDGSAGLPDQAPFDAINVAAAARRDVLERLAQQLSPGGRMAAPLSRNGSQHLAVATRSASDGSTAWEVLEAVRFVPLVS